MARAGQSAGVGFGAGAGAAGAEAARLASDGTREHNWKRWGPYLSERQWGTVREDYSAKGDCWDYFPHDHARSRAYRWGEDGLLGICDRQCRLCFALALWNGRDPILKERLFGLTGPEGNHGEDVKELYFYLDSTPTHSYMRALYKYPQSEFPYERLVRENAVRGRSEPEYEVAETGVFDGSRYFDVEAEYAKAGPEDILIRITVTNRGEAEATLTVLPTAWFRNGWSWGCRHEGCEVKPVLRMAGDRSIRAEHATLGEMTLHVEGIDGAAPEFVFTENETNSARLYGVVSGQPYVKDAFHAYVVEGKHDAVNPAQLGTKAAAVFRLRLAGGERRLLRLRLVANGKDAGEEGETFGEGFEGVFVARKREADEFYWSHGLSRMPEAARPVARQAYAGLLWSKQFYEYIVEDWLSGDSLQPPPPGERLSGRNADWQHLYNRDVISMPDKWEYPWYAAWDLAFHMIPFARIDREFSKEQLMLLLREWYMHPNGQIPAYEFALGDVNPPVHAWACWRVYKMTGPRGGRDTLFLARTFQKLLINFTWWVNRKDPHGKHLFSGGFLGLDNIGVFDRSRPLPTGGTLEQADGTAWMAFYCGTMLSMALELARTDPAYEDMASKFFEHFVSITDAMNTLGGNGLWDPHDGFYYDQIRLEDGAVPLRVRSLVGIIPILACEILEQETIDALPGFKKRMEWFLRYRKDLAKHISYLTADGHHRGPGRDGSGGDDGRTHRLLAIPSRERLVNVLRYMLDENEFLSPHGVRSVSKVHGERPYVFHAKGEEFRVDYTPGESSTGLFGGNSNWRGPVWFPINFLIIEALERYYHFYGDDLRVECPTGSGRHVTLLEVATEIRSRLSRLFLADGSGRRACFGTDARWARDPHFRDLLLFHEYFHGDTGLGLGASHQTGWTALIAPMLEEVGVNGAGGV